MFTEAFHLPEKPIMITFDDGYLNNMFTPFRCFRNTT